MLLPYTHPALMAGRRRELADLRRRLRMPILIRGLYATSGTGKSSLLLGGLIPELRAGGRPVALTRHPHEPGVAARLAGDLLEGDDPVAAADVEGFVERLEEAERLAGETPLLVLDQLEEALRSEAIAARTRLGLLLAATARRRPGLDEPPCRWLLVYRQEFHGELLSWLGDVLRDAEVAGVDTQAVGPLPHDLSRPERFHSLPLAPLATPSAGGTTSNRQHGSSSPPSNGRSPCAAAGSRATVGASRPGTPSGWRGPSPGRGSSAPTLR